MGSNRLGRTVTGYALLVPSLIGVLVFLLAPIGIVIWLSFQRWDLIGPRQFVGFDNWVSVLTGPDLVNSLIVTALLVLLVIPIQTLLGLLMAALMVKGLPGSGVFRVIYVIPWVCTPLALGIVWKWIFAPTGGALNALIGTRVEWLTDPTLALPAVAFVSIWSQAGYVALFFMAGLAAIPEDIIEAARVDGASDTRIFWSIKVPLIRPTMFFVLVTSTISVFQMFGQIFALTEGGPAKRTEVLSYRIYNLAFTNFDLGRASVTALVLFVILVAITLIQNRYFSRRMTYEYS